MSVLEKTVVINNPQGLHARPAELFAKLALQFDSTIEVIRDSHRVDAKSILHVLTLGAAQGTQLTLQADGSDAEAALEALARLVESDFATDETMSQGKLGIGKTVCGGTNLPASADPVSPEYPLGRTHVKRLAQE